ncbi:MAG: type II toxin-antitoxin system antitoxin SocA domain-containing protein [Liquorilactobacillus nagelii]|uniref:Panacea domain-containing protein n=1 Tax=Lactobacillaceae TaxID=33958 RepID=UPI0039E927DC
MTEYSAEEVANWFLTRQKAHEKEDDGIDPMTQMKLHKLLYYAQGVCLAVTGSRLFKEDLLAWEHGPVVRQIFDKYRGQRTIDDDLSKEQLDDFEKIATNDKQANNILEAVYERYSDYSASQLRNMTHSELPWKETEHNGVISQELMESFFKENIVA